MLSVRQLSSQGEEKLEWEKGIEKLVRVPYIVCHVGQDMTSSIGNPFPKSKLHDRFTCLFQSSHHIITFAFAYSQERKQQK